MPTIRIDSDVYALLQEDARPFEDTPNSVLRRKFGLKEQNKIFKKENRIMTSKQTRTEKTPQRSFREPILKALKKFGGEGLRKPVLDRIEMMMEGQLTEYDNSDINSGSIRWQKSAEWEVRAMREQGLLKPVHETPRGVWALTKKGHETVSDL